MSKGNGSEPIAPQQTFKTSGPININGVGEIAQRLPDDNWYMLTIHIRKIEGGAEVKVSPKWERIA